MLQFGDQSIFMPKWQMVQIVSFTLWFEKCMKVYSALASLLPLHDSPLILVQLLWEAVTGEAATPRREAPGRRNCFGVVNWENTHVNEAVGKKLGCDLLRIEVEIKGWSASRCSLGIM